MATQQHARAIGARTENRAVKEMEVGRARTCIFGIARTRLNEADAFPVKLLPL